MERESPQKWEAQLDKTISRVIAVIDPDKLTAEQHANVMIFSISERNIKVSRQTHNHRQVGLLVLGRNPPTLSFNPLEKGYFPFRQVSRS